MGTHTNAPTGARKQTRGPVRHLPSSKGPDGEGWKLPPLLVVKRCFNREHRRKPTERATVVNQPWTRPVPPSLTSVAVSPG